MGIREDVVAGADLAENGLDVLIVHAAAPGYTLRSVCKSYPAGVWIVETADNHVSTVLGSMHDAVLFMRSAKALRVTAYVSYVYDYRPPHQDYQRCIWLIGSGRIAPLGSQ